MMNLLKRMMVVARSINLYAIILKTINSLSTTHKLKTCGLAKAQVD